MSILSGVFSGKISFTEAVSEAEGWFSTLISKAPAAVQTAATTGLSDFKQAASDAVGLADTLLGPILATATTAVEATANTAIAAAVGPSLSGQITPSIDAGITSVTNALHAEIDAVAAQIRAKLVTPASS